MQKRLVHSLMYAYVMKRSVMNLWRFHRIQKEKNIYQI